jgi:hypothetical protein
MKYFICSMANDGRKNIVPLLTDSVGQLEKFAEDHDQPGRAVYACVNPLRSDATARVKEQVGAIVTLHVDIDFKRLATPPDEVRRKIMELPLPFEVRESGGGLHVLANLKEAYESGTEHFRRAEGLRTQLMTLLCGDPAPNHSAALLRVVGTHNSKYDEPVEVSVIRAGELVDIVDVEAFLDLYSQPLFELEDGYLPASNVVSLDVPFVPIDTDAVLGDMPTTGEGINAVQYRLLRALIVREGLTPQEAVDAVVSATMTMAVAHQPDWTFDTEFKCVTARMKWVLGRLEKEHWPRSRPVAAPLMGRQTGCRPIGEHRGLPGARLAARRTFIAMRMATASGRPARRRRTAHPNRKVPVPPRMTPLISRATIGSGWSTSRT